MLLFTNHAFADTNWVGSISNNWHTPGNWTAGVPDGNDAVDIPVVTLSNVYPVITAAAAVKDLDVLPGAFLNIAIGGTLSSSGGILLRGSMENNGSLSINNVAYVAFYVRPGALFTNRGTINIGNTGDIDYSGIQNEGTFMNESGSISINRTGKTVPSTAAILNKGTFTNKANISIGAVSPGLYCNVGIWNDGAGANFSNEGSGTISINRAVNDGLYNTGTFNNKGSIAIGTAGNLGGSGIDNRGTFNNSPSTAYINIASDNIIRNLGTFNNAGVIIEHASGDCSITSNTGVVQNLNGGDFTIPSGSAAIIATGPIWAGSSDATWNTASNWHNNTVPTASDDVTIADVTTYPVVSSVDAVAKSITVQAGGELTVAATGILTINGSTTQGVLNQGTVTNNGQLKVGLTTSTGSYGIRNEGTFNNSLGILTIDKATQAALYNVSGTFTNSATLSLKTNVAAPFLINSLAGTITNSGTLSGAGVINPTHFTNAGGTLSPGYSPGILTFSGNENFSSSTIAIEVNGSGVAGTSYDQIIVNGTATLGGTLALTFNFPVPSSGDVVKILDATALSGTFSAITGLPTGWIVNYNRANQGEITLSYLVSLPVNLVRFTAKKLDNSVLLNWQTSSETDNQGFDIERRLDDGNWENIGFVDGNGSTKESKTYSFLDQNPLPATNYYRLRQVDFDGNFEYSRIVGVKMDRENLVKIYPNPTTGLLHIEGVQPAVKIMDILGRPVMNSAIVNQKIDISNLPAGHYIMSVFSGNTEKSISILKH